MSDFFNYYDLLDVEPRVTTSEITQAYKQKAIIYHPDKNQGSQVANDMFKLLGRAKDCLTDVEQRLAYDYQIGVKQKPEQYSEPTVEYIIEKEEPDLKTTLQVGLAALAVGYAVGRIRKSRKKKK